MDQVRINSYLHLRTGAGKIKKYLHGEWFVMPSSKRRITNGGIWLCSSEALILNAPWVAHPDVILFQFIEDFIIALGYIVL